MITMSTKISVPGISGKSVANFMLHCTDEDYREWWPGTHLAFHTTRRFPNDRGNHVIFDEYVGRRRLRFRGVVVRNVPGKAITWQMIKVVRLPAWLVLEFDDNDTGVVMTHTIKAGYAGVGQVLDLLLRLYLTQSFERDMAEHARVEFAKLAENLKAREQSIQASGAEAPPDKRII